PKRRLCRSYSEGCKGGRFARGAIHEIRVRNKSQNRKVARRQNLRQSDFARRRGDRVRRRELITLLGGTAAAWPLAARAQQVGPVRRVGVLAGYDDPQIKAFWQELERLGWAEGRNVHVDYRYAPAGAQVQALARELVAAQPDVIFAQSRPVTA